MILVITEQQMINALKANGWIEYWTSEYFILKNSQGHGIPLKDGLFNASAFKDSATGAHGMYPCKRSHTIL